MDVEGAAAAASTDGNAPSQTGLAPRRAALRALEACFIGGQTLDEAFGPHRAALSPSDAGLAWAICQEVAREKLRLKTLKQAFLKRPLPKNAAAANLILDIALVQLVKLDSAPHAAISTAVELAKRDKRPAIKSHAKLINAVLRNVERKRAAGTFYLPKPSKALPPWLAKRWQDQFGAEGADELAKRYLAPPPLHVAAKTPAAAEALRQHPGAQDLGLRTAFPPGTSPRTLPGFDAGDIWVQDRCASLPAAVLSPTPGAFCYDLCAAPGGKTMQLAAMGADVLAVDISEDRLALLKDNLRRTKLRADIFCADLTEWVAPAPADFILLDAPCSALGTFQRHPEVLHQRRPTHIAPSAERQAQILGQAWKALKPGGVFVYAVCSLEPEEGALQIADFTARTGDAVLTPLKPSDYDLPDAARHPSGGLLTAPHVLKDYGGGDGFFIAKLQRKA